MKTRKIYYSIDRQMKSNIFKNASKVLRQKNNTFSWSDCLRQSWIIAKSKPDFEGCYIKYNKEISKYILFNKFSGKNSHIVEEIIQDVFIKANKHYHNFNPFLSNIKSWLINIANNTVIDYWRKNKHENSKIHISDFVDEKGNEYFTIKSDIGSDNSESETLSNAINKALDNLTENYKRVFTLRELEGKNYNEISKTLNISEATARVILNRAKKALQKELKQYSSNIA